jgi:putative ABC transport system permease protein
MTPDPTRKNPPETDLPPTPSPWLSWMVPGAYRDDLVGDLQEEYLDLHLPRRGKVEATRWFRREFRRAVRVNLKTRFHQSMRGRSAPPPASRPTGNSGGFPDSIIQDLRFASRSLLRSRSFTVIAILTLALGIGANTAIFSVLDGVMLKPLPFAEPEHLVVPWETFQPREIMTGTVSYPNLEEWRERSRVFDGMAGMHPEAYTLTGRGLPERIQGARVTAEFLPLLGVRPAQGRLFLPEDDEEGALDVAIVTEGFWTRHFGDSPLQGEETLILSDRPPTIVGVLPTDFDFPFAVSGAEVWTPSALDYVSYYHREWPRLIPFARLRDGVGLADAQAEMDRVAAELSELYPETNQDHGANVVSLMKQVPSRVSGQLMVLLGAVGLVLFVACMNVANLLLARGMDRQRELGVRSALGAGRWRVVRQLVTEGLLLSVLGGALGMALAWGGTGLLVSLLPENYPRVGDIGVDGRTLLFAAGASFLTCLLAAVLPAIQTAGRDIHGALKEGSRTSLTRRHQRVRRFLVVSEVALAVVVLVGAGLLVRSFERMNAVDPGFDAEGVLTFRIATDWSAMQVYERAGFYGELVETLAALPGVTAAGAGSILPIAGRFHATFQHDGEPELPRAERPGARYVSVTPTYFETMGIPFLRGETFSDRDQRDGPGVILVNEAAASEFWPHEDPVGQYIRPDVDITDVDPVLFQVVGVVGNVRDLRLDEEPTPTLYVPHTQQTWPALSVAVRSTVESAALIPQIRTVVNDLSQEASFSFRDLDEVLAETTEERRFLTLVMGLFGLLALTLAGVGVFGVLSYSVVQRTREMGLRRALGADGSSVYRMVTRESLALILLGGGLGIGGSLFANRLVSSLLFGVESTDAITYLTVVALLVASGLLASFLPARSATRIDPMVALKLE